MRGADGVMDAPTTQLRNARSPHGDPICPACNMAIPNTQSVVVRNGFIVHLTCVADYDAARPRAED
jgi:hypothetical protein